jgi:hypothetical protein
MKFSSKSVFGSRRYGGALLLVGVLAGVTVGGGVGVIAASSTKTVTVCANKKTNMLRYAKNGKCVKKTETKVVLNQTGVKGDAGVTGAAGATGAKGDTGAAGVKGDPGAAGTNGTNGTNGANTNSQIKNICGDNGTTACAVGLKGPGGGIVFITPSTLGNTSGLFYEAAPSTWNSLSGDPIKEWCDISGTMLGVDTPLTTTGPMDGANKTAVMLGACSSGAANLADEYTATVNGVVYGDWFLPSKGELNQMYLHRNVITGFAGAFYWSSSETIDLMGLPAAAWGQYFSDGGQYYATKAMERYVRPVRAF